MYNHPYVLKKQVISLIFFSFTLIFVYLTKNLIYLEVVFYYLATIISITFIPLLRKKIKYSLFFHAILYYFTLYLPIFIIDIDLINIQNFIGIVAGVVVGIVLIFTNYNHNKRYISSQNYMIFNKINFKEFIYHIFKYIYSVIGEELFYRYFIIGYLYKYIGIYAVPVSAIMFVFSHFINRWANVYFNYKSYIYHGITGLVFGVIFFYTKSIYGCIISHLIFNGPEFIVICKRYKYNKENAELLFDDYD